MLVTPLGPAETIKWFEEVDRQHELLCFIITANPEHRKLLANLAQNYIDADAALGTKVAFILFGGNDVHRFPAVDFPYSTQMFPPGEALHPTALHNYASQSDFGRSAERGKERQRDDDFYDHQADWLAAESAKEANTWMKLMGVTRQSLPALCVLIKGNDPTVINLGEKIDTATVLRLFGRLADIAERHDEAFACTFQAEATMKRALALGSDIQKLESSFHDQVDAMCNRFKATLEERKLMAEFLASKVYSIEALDQTLSQCSFAAKNDFSSNTTVKGVRSKLNKVAGALVQLEECQPREDHVISVREALQSINARRQESAKLVGELAAQGIKAKLVARESLGVTYDKYAARASQTATLLEKLGKLVGLVSGAGLLAVLMK